MDSPLSPERPGAAARKHAQQATGTNSTSTTATTASPGRPIVVMTLADMITLLQHPSMETRFERAHAALCIIHHLPLADLRRGGFGKAGTQPAYWGLHAVKMDKAFVQRLGDYVKLRLSEDTVARSGK